MNPDQGTMFEPNPNAETPKEVLTELVGEGKKYKTAEDLARSRLQADIHITKVEKENAELRDKLAGAKAVEDVLEAVKASAVSGRDSPDLVNSPAQGLTAAEIASIVQEQVTGLETKRERILNRKKADIKMRELFGEKAEEVFKEQAATPELFKLYTELAEVDPEKFVSLFKRGSEKSPIDSGGSQTRVISQPTSEATDPGTQGFYSKMRKENPSLYYSAATQLKMHQAALSNPDKYFGRTKT